MRLLPAIAAMVAWSGLGIQASGSVTVVALPVPLMLYDPTNGVPTHTAFDIDSDGGTDFTFSHGLSLNLRTERANRIVIFQDPPPNLGGPVEVLPTSYVIGSSLSPGNGWASSDLLGGYVSPGELSFAQIVQCFDTGCGSRMPEVLSRVFFGIEFQLNGNTHYGYFDVEGQHDTVGVIIHGWAYETMPNTSITTSQVPEPGRTALLLLGVTILLRRRRRALGSG